MMTFWLQLPYSMIATCGFCILFNVPLRKFPMCIAVGAAGWMSYKLFVLIGMGPIPAAFIGACLVWLLSNVFARLFKEASTVFIVPGIICLVPGAGTYYTMLALIDGTAGEFADAAKETVLTAGAIAAGLLTMGSVTGVLILMVHKLRRLRA